MPLTIDARKLLAWNDTTLRHWQAFIAAHPAVFSLPSDIRNSTTVADVFQHIVAAELRYASRLASLPEPEYAAIPKHSIDDIVRTHEEASALIERQLADRDYNWAESITFTTITMGQLRSSRESVLLHLTFHSIRHYAQLATLVRQAGYKPDWPLDYLFMNAERA